MKKFKKLIPAFCMLLVSAILLGSSTYAWFSMNKTVTATGMQVTAKSNSSYLLIDSVDNATTKTTSALTKAAAFVSGGTNEANNGTCTEAHEHNETNCGDKWVKANTDKVIYPTYYATASGTMPGTAATDADLSVTEGHWYTANNQNSDNANNATKTPTDLGTTALVQYVCTYNSWLTLSSDSEDYTGIITVKSTVSGDAGTSVIVVLSDGTNTETLKLTNGTATSTTKNFTIKSTTSVSVTYYVYIDGTTTNVTSNYINGTALTGTISVEFNIQ